MFISHIDLTIVLNGFKLGKSLGAGTRTIPTSRQQQMDPFWNMWTYGSVSIVTVHGLFIPNVNSRQREFHQLGLNKINLLSWPAMVGMRRGPNGHVGDMTLQIYLCVPKGKSWGRRNQDEPCSPHYLQKSHHLWGLTHRSSHEVFVSHYSFNGCDRGNIQNLSFFSLNIFCKPLAVIINIYTFKVLDVFYIFGCILYISLGYTSMERRDHYISHYISSSSLNTL